MAVVVSFFVVATPVVVGSGVVEIVLELVVASEVVVSSTKVVVG